MSTRADQTSGGNPVYPFKAWIWDADAARTMSPTSERFATAAAAKGWLLEKITADPGAERYGIDHDDGTEVLLSESCRRDSMDRCAKCHAPNPTLVDEDHGILCNDCSEALAAGEDLDSLAALTDAIFGEGQAS